MKTLSSFLPAILSAALVILSTPPSGFFWIAFTALAPLLFVLRESSLVRAAALSFLFGYLHGIGIFWWLTSVEGVGLELYLLVLAPLYALYYTAFGVSYNLMACAFPRLTFLLGPALWVSVEFIRAHMFFLALPWNLLGHTQHAVLPVIGIADLTGVYGVSFLLVLVNEVVSRWLETVLSKKQSNKFSRQHQWSSLKVPTAVAVLSLIFTVSWSVAPGQVDNQAETVRLALLQPNVVTSEIMSYQDQNDHLEIYSTFTREAAGRDADLIAWPASSLPGSLSSRIVKAHLRELIKDLNTYLLVGWAAGQKLSPAEGKKERYANTEFLFNADGRPGGRYNKQHLVPFNEYLPLDDLIHWPRWVTTLEGNYRPGERNTLFVLKKAKFGVPICWESLFPDLFRRFVKEGANFMVNVTNEAYMGDTAGPYQTHAMNVFRAVENRITLARVSATGISSFIGPDGRVLETVRDADGKELFVPGILVRDIPLLKERTFYTMHGDLFAWAMIAVTIVLLAVSIRAGPVEEP